MPDETLTEFPAMAPPELIDVLFFEVSAKRLDVATEPQPMEIPLVAQIGQPEDNSEIIVRIAVDLAGHQADFRVDVAARYKLEEPRLFTDPERVSFAESGPMLTLVPFVREALMSSASRLRVDVPLVPLLRVRVPLTGRPEATGSSGG
jgi:hypothetical protein